jgi:formylglycine-generating enzyme required for sulfatase activity
VRIDLPSLISIPESSFLMGCETGADNERPLHRVRVDRFEIGACQVTNREFALFLQSTGHAPPPMWGRQHVDDPAQPVVAVSWFDAVAYCDWLSGVSGRSFRLPSEAEWECAARGGAEQMLYPWGNDPPQSRPNYATRWLTGPEPVGGSAPNAFGLYDMCENVHEWCSDWYAATYDDALDQNPRGPASGARRVSRGGSWRHQVKVSRCAARSSIPPEFQYADYGFRVCR